MKREDAKIWFKAPYNPYPRGVWSQAFMEGVISGAQDYYTFVRNPYLMEDMRKSWQQGFDAGRKSAFGPELYEI